MLGKWLLGLLAPLALMVTLLGACEQQGVQPGYQTSSAGYRGESGRVVSIRDVELATGGGSGVSQGTLVGGGLGGAGGAIAGAAIGGTAGAAVVGGLLGAVGGAIAGTAIDRNSPRRGIAVTVQKDDGQTITIAQRDEGDVQMGDRVIIVYDKNGVAKAMRDTGYRRD